MSTDRNGLDVLDRAQCLELLGRATIGRIALSVDALPTVLPVNFRLLDDRVLFRCSLGSKLDAATAGSVIAFEVDDVDPIDHTGWSVVVTGRATVVPLGTLPPDAETAIPRWAPHGPSRVVALSTELVSGRRISHHRTAADGDDSVVERTMLASTERGPASGGTDTSTRGPGGRPGPGWP